MPFLIPFIAAALVEIGVGAITASIIASAVVSIGLSLISSLLFAPSIPKPADGKIPKRQSIPPRIRAFGRCRMSGSYMLYEATPAGDSVDVLALHDGLIDGFEDFYLHDDLVTVTANVVQPLADGSYGGSKIKIYTRLGANPETAYSEVVAELGSIWTTDHRGDGIASLALICTSVKAKDFSKIYPNQLPQPSAVARWRLVFDPRVTGQDAGDPSTWAWSDNPVLMLLTYLIDDMDENYTTRILPEIDAWITAADVCDQGVSLDGGGTEKRYRAGGFYQMDNDPADVMQTILSTFDGWLGETGAGALKCFAGAFYAPTVTIPQKHIIGFRVQKYLEDEQAVNEIVFTYVDPAQKYTEVEGAPLRDEADISERGKVRSQNIPLTWVQSHTQGRRLAKREMYRVTSTARGTITTDLYGFLGLGERYLNISIPELPSLCTFPAQINNTRIDIANGSLTFDWVMVTAAIDDWTPATDEGSPPGTGAAGAPSVIPALTGLVVVYSPAQTALIITFDTPMRIDLAFAVRYRLTSGPGEWVDKLYDSADTSGPTVTLQSPAILPNSSYDVEVAAVGPGGTYGPYTAAVTVSTAAAAVPGFPTGFSASPGVGQNVLNWNAAPATDSVTGYRVYRAAGTGASFGSSSLVATLGVVATWTDTGRTPGTGYTYFLKAENAIGLSGAAGGVDCTTLSTLPTSPPLRISGGTGLRKPDAGEELFSVPMFTGDKLKWNGSSGFANAAIEIENGGAAPTADWTLVVKKNGATIATGTIAAGATVGAFTGVTADITFTDGDTLKGVAIAPQDTTAVGITFAIIGERTK